MIQYFRRFRMELDFSEYELARPSLPAGFEFLRWNPRELERHAVAKFNSFRDELDSQVFPCLGDLDGCRKLMVAIVTQKGFLPEATWLIAREPDRRGFCEDCGVIQGLTYSEELGSIQNVGVIPSCRGQGVGRAMVLKSLHGFRDRGVKRVFLEVTAENEPAVELYRSLGFRLIRTSYREVAEVLP